MNTQYKKGVLELCVLALVLTEPKNTKSLRLCRRLFRFMYYFLTKSRGNIVSESSVVSPSSYSATRVSLSPLSLYS